MMELLLLTLAVVFIIDLSGFTATLLNVISRATGRRYTQLKPFTCSLCSTFWLGNIYAAAAGFWSIGTFAYICLLAYLTPVLRYALETATDALTMLIRSINKIWK